MGFCKAKKQSLILEKSVNHTRGKNYTNSWPQWPWLEDMFTKTGTDLELYTLKIIFLCRVGQIYVNLFIIHKKVCHPYNSAVPWISVFLLWNLCPGTNSCSLCLNRMKLAKQFPHFCLFYEDSFLLYHIMKLHTQYIWNHNHCLSPTLNLYSNISLLKGWKYIWILKQDIERFEVDYKNSYSNEGLILFSSFSFPLLIL